MKAHNLMEKEYSPYYKGYINVAGDKELLKCLTVGIDSFERLMNNLPEERLQYAYAPKKWTIAEVLLHIIDAERVFAYRALRFSRKDATPLARFEQDDYVPVSNANIRSKQSILDEFISVRKATISLFQSFDESQLRFIGTASNSPMSVAALGFVICGHQNHHIKIILDRYLN